MPATPPLAENELPFPFSGGDAIGGVPDPALCGMCPAYVICFEIDLDDTEHAGVLEAQLEHLIAADLKHLSEWRYQTLPDARKLVGWVGTSYDDLELWPVRQIVDDAPKVYRFVSGSRHRYFHHPELPPCED